MFFFVEGFLLLKKEMMMKRNHFKYECWHFWVSLTNLEDGAECDEILLSNIKITMWYMIQHTAYISAFSIGYSFWVLVYLSQSDNEDGWMVSFKGWITRYRKKRQHDSWQTVTITDVKLFRNIHCNIQKRKCL